MKKLLTLLLAAMMLAAVLAVPAYAVLYKSYSAAANGELLYVADFRGENIFKPVTHKRTAGGVKYTPSADGKSLNIKAVSGNNKKEFNWGGAITGLKADKTTVYTLFYKIRMNGKNGQDNSIGVGGLAWYTPEDSTDLWRFYNNYSNYNSQFNDTTSKNRSALSVNNQKIGSYVNVIDEAVPDADGFISCRIDFNGPANKFSAYALTASGWKKIEEQDMKEKNTDAAYQKKYTDANGVYDVGIYLYSYYDIVDLDLKDVRYYKGVNLTADQLKVSAPAAQTTAAAATKAASTAAKTTTAAKTADASVVIAALMVAALSGAVVLRRKH